MRRWLQGLAIWFAGCGGGGDHPSAKRCLDLYHHLLEVEADAFEQPIHSDDLTQAFEQRCPKTITSKEVECGLAARSVEAADRCLPRRTLKCLVAGSGDRTTCAASTPKSTAGNEAIEEARLRTEGAAATAAAEEERRKAEEGARARDGDAAARVESLSNDLEALDREMQQAMDALVAADSEDGRAAAKARLEAVKARKAQLLQEGTSGRPAAKPCPPNTPLC